MTYSAEKPSGAYKVSLADAIEHQRHSKTWCGKLAIRHIEPIRELIRDVEAEDVLDYGCGKGVQYFRPIDADIMLEDYWGVPVFKYDPAVPRDFKRPPDMPAGFSIETALPPDRQWDVVICTHVLGSIPLVDLRDWVIPLLHARARKAIYFAENLNTPKKDKLFRTTDDKPREWDADQWMELLSLEGSDVEVHGWFRGLPGNDPRKSGHTGPNFRRWPFEDE